MASLVTAEHLDEDTAECIARCAACHAACAEALDHGLGKGGPYVAPAVVRSLEDCGQLCDLARDLLLRDSPLTVEVRELCHQACARCVETCAELAGGDTVIEHCVECCRRCSESCRAVAA
jgi:hypothetical protein